MNLFTLTEDASVLGPKHAEYGFKYWVETDKGHVSFSSHLMSFTIDTKIVAETATPKTSAKGNDYLWLTKVKKVEDGGSTTASSLNVDASETKHSATEPHVNINTGFTSDDREMLKKILEYVQPITDIELED